MINNSIQIKDSEIDWIGKFPSDWELLRIKNIFKLSREKIDGQAEKYQIYSLTMQGLKKRDVSTNEGQVAASYDNYARLRENDIVLNPMDLISGFIGRQKEDGIISPAYSLLRPRNDYNTRYFERYLQYHYFYRIFFPFGKGVSYDYRWTLGDITLMNFPILKPPKKEQEKIVEFLDEKTENISRLIEKKKKMIELLKEKRSSIITHAVTKGLDPNVEMKDSGVDYIGKIPNSWEFKKTSQVFTKIGSGTTPSSGSVDYYNDDGEYWVQSGDLNASILRDTKKRITQKAVLEYPTLKFYEKDSIVIAMYGASVGNLSLIKINATTNQACCVLPKTEKINSKFAFYYYLISKDTLISFGQGGSQPNINKELIKSFKILLPSKEIQKEIVKYLDKKTSEINNIISKIEKQIKLLGDYRASLIYHAVTGKMMDEI
jgi:type I restriction enzyme S subunit